MAYIPVAQRGGAGSTGYVPVAARTNAAPISTKGPTLNLPSVFTPTANSTSPTTVDSSGPDFTPLVASIVQAGPRAGGTLVETGKQLVTGQPESVSADTPLSKLIFGDEPVESLQTKTAQTQKDLSGVLPESVAKPLGAFTAIGSLALDLSPIGGEKNAFTAIAKVSDFADAAKLARTIGVEEDLVETAAKSFVEAKSVEEAKQAVDAITHMQKTTKAYTPVAARAADVPEAKAASEIAPELEPLAAEARKYASAEEFVKAQGEPLYHGTSDIAAEDISKNGFDLKSEGMNAGNGVSLTDDKEIANIFGEEGKTIDAVLTNDTKLVSPKEFLITKNDFGEKSGFETATQKAIDFYKEKGYDGVDFRKGNGSIPDALKSEVRIWNPEKIKTKDQLIEIYKSATKAEKTGASLPLTETEGAALSEGYQARNAHRSPTRDASDIESLDRTAREQGLPPLPKLRPKGASAVRDLLDEGLSKAKQGVEEAKVGRAIGRDTLDVMPGKALQKFESRATGALPEVTGKDEILSISGSGKLVANSKFGREGDKIVQELGFSSVEAAQKALDDYKDLRAQVKDAEASVRAKVKDYRDRKAVFDEVIRYVNAQARARREKVKAVQEFFVLDDKDMQGLMKGERDIRLMSDQEFGDFMKRIEGKATENYLRSQALVELKSTIFDNELKKTQNLYRALKLPKVENMSIGQIKKLNEFMSEFKQGDEFLGPRQLETIKHTDLKGIYTRREALEKLVEQINKSRSEAGKPPVTIADLDHIKPDELDRYRYDTALARQNPLYELMVQEKNEAFLGAEMKVMDASDRVDELFKAARQSRERSLIDRLIPMDSQIFRWLESSDAEKIKLAKDMTDEELEAAMHIRASYAEMRDYLVENQTLKKFVKDYVTHVRRGFLEAWREEGSYVKGMASGEKAGPVQRAAHGFLAAIKDSFKQYLQDEAYFNILDQQTDTVLPLEKFFQFSMKRTGELVPSKNVAKAYLQYLSTFEKKRALDSIVPKLDIYVHSLTPSKLTPRGLEFDSSLKRFFKEWLNSKKGRATDRALVKPGGKVDWGLRTGVALTRLIDLGFSVPVGIASNLGAQAAVFRGLGTKAYAEGLARTLTPQGRNIIRKYRAFTGEPVLSKAFSAKGTLGESLMNGIFGLFSFADRQARQAYLLGRMTPEEFAKGELSTRKLAQMQTDLGRHLPVEGFESIIGKTAIGKVGSQYKSWAVPLLSSTADDLSKLYHAVKTGDVGFVKSPEFAELLRTAVISTAVGLGAYGILTDKTPVKDQSFGEKLAHKAANDALSLIGALDPTLWSSVRLLSFLNNLATSVKQIVLLERNQKDELTGVNTLESTVTPAAVKQLLPPASTAKKTSLPGGAKLPPLPKLNAPKFPKLPKLPKAPKF